MLHICQSGCRDACVRTDRLSAMKEEKVGNVSVKVECKAVLNTLAARETEDKVHTLGNTLSELKHLEKLHTLSAS